MSVTGTCIHGYNRANEYCPQCDNRNRIVALEQELATLRAEVAELRKNKERMKWMLDNPMAYEDLFEEVFYESGIAGANDEMKAVVLKRIDAAIDAEKPHERVWVGRGELKRTGYIDAERMK